MLELTLALIIFLFPLAYSPGPGNMFFAANGARFGFQGTIPANIGYHIATWLITFAIGYGFAQLAAQFPTFFLYISYLGVSYMLYLAWSFIKAGHIDKQQQAKTIGFWDGVILLLLNPKAYFIISAMFAQFLTQDNSLFPVLWISTVFTLNNLIAFCLWAYAGDRLFYLFRTKANAKKLNSLFALMLIGVALWMLTKLI